MKNLLIMLFVLTAFNLFGQELDDGQVDGPKTEKVISLWQTLIPIAVPMMVAGLKYLIPKIPKMWIPVAAIALGAIIDILLNLADLGAGKGLVGAILGAAAVGLREVLNETKKAAQNRISQ